MNNKVSLYDASSALSAIMEIIDEEGVVNDHLLAEFKNSALQVAEAIDRRKFVIKECESRIATGKQMVKDIRDHLKRLEKTKDKIKESTLSVMQANPDQKYTDSLGRKISVRESAGKLDLKVNVTSLSVANCIDPNEALIEDVRPYVATKTVIVLDTARIIADLKAGKTLSFAQLKKNSYLSGL